MPETREKLLDIAQELTQKKGFNAFSYADIAREIGIRKASIHYHFPTKADLGEALVNRYSERFEGMLDEIEAGKTDTGAMLNAYLDLYEDTLNQDNMCLCGMLASDTATLPEKVKTGVEKFFHKNEEWLTGVLDKGRYSGGLSFSGSSDVYAKVFLSQVQGALLVSRGYGGAESFHKIRSVILGTLITQD